MKIILTNNLTDSDYKPSKKLVQNILKTAKMTLATEDTKRTLVQIPSSLEVGLTITSDKAIRRLNQKHRGKDTATDVLSFPMYEVDEKLLPHTSLGDIIISMDTMARQAKAYGHSQNREFCFLFVHGLLHLLGYDHEISQAEEKLQFSRQDEVLEILNIVK